MSDPASGEKPAEGRRIDPIHRTMSVVGWRVREARRTWRSGSRNARSGCAPTRALPGAGARIPPAAHRGAVRGGPQPLASDSVAKPVAESTPERFQTVAGERESRPSRLGRRCRLQGRRRSSAAHSGRAEAPGRRRPDLWGVPRLRHGEAPLGPFRLAHGRTAVVSPPCLHLPPAASRRGRQRASYVRSLLSLRQ